MSLPTTEAGKRLAAEVGVQYRIDLIARAEVEAVAAERTRAAEAGRAERPIAVDLIDDLNTARQSLQNGMEEAAFFGGDVTITLSSALAIRDAIDDRAQIAGERCYCAAHSKHGHPIDLARDAIEGNR